MKKCPSCAYGNPSSAVKCHVCGRDLAAVPERPDPQPEKSSSHMPLAALALAACAAAFWLLQRFAWLPAAPAPAAADDPSFSYDGVVYSLEKMGELRFLPDADKLRAADLLSSPDERAAAAAARAAGAWAREGAPAFRQDLLGRLAAAALSGRDAVRREAALQAGTLLALGLPAGSHAEKLSRAAAALAARPETELKAAGFYLSSMAGGGDLVPQMRRTLEYDPSSAAKLYAACALSRLGYPEGHERLARDAGGADPVLRNEALACLAYSASPEADLLLARAARDAADPAGAESAKSALIFRKQLVIIKK